MKIKLLTEYDVKTANRVRELLIQLSRSGKDRGEIPKEWFNDLISSDSHDMLLAIDDSGKVQGIATLSIIMGPIVRKVAYLEDFVTDETCRGQGVGSKLWDAILNWSKTKGVPNSISPPATVGKPHKLFIRSAVPQFTTPTSSVSPSKSLFHRHRFC